MSVAIRVIPCLDVAAGRVVKGVNFLDLRDAGDPVELSHRYYDEGADELTFLDVKATVEARQTMLDVVQRTAEQVHIPLTVGGGVRSAQDVATLLARGADKIGVNSAAVNRPELIREIAEQFGRQVVVLSLDITRDPTMPSGFVVTTRGGRQRTELDAVEWTKQAIDLGAGELLVNSIDTDGVQEGFDLELIDTLRAVASVPFIASGGAGKVEHFVEAVRHGADAVLAASVFHHRVIAINDVKAAIAAAGYPVRTTPTVEEPTAAWKRGSV